MLCKDVRHTLFFKTLPCERVVVQQPALNCCWPICEVQHRTFSACPFPFSGSLAAPTMTTLWPRATRPQLLVASSWLCATMCSCLCLALMRAALMRVRLLRTRLEWGKFIEGWIEREREAMGTYNLFAKHQNGMSNSSVTYHQPILHVLR